MRVVGRQYAFNRTRDTAAMIKYICIYVHVCVICVYMYRYVGVCVMQLFLFLVL